MKTKRTFACVLVAGLAAVGVGTAYAANGHRSKATARAEGGFAHHGGASDDLDAAASYLGTTASALLTQLRSGKTLAAVAAATDGKTASGLVDALVAHERTELAGKVTAGTITQAQADMLTADLPQRMTDFVNGTFRAGPFGAGHGPGPGFGHGHGPGFGHGDALDAAAAYLGTTASALQTELQAGKTLAQVASATSGKSTSGLVDALVAKEKTEWAAAVTAGRLTQAQVDAMTANLTQRVTDLVNGTRPAFGGRPGWRH